MKTTYNKKLDLNALNDAAWEYTAAWQELVGEHMTPTHFNMSKSLVAAALVKYLELAKE